MKLSLWDKLSLNITGRLPKKTQAQLNQKLEEETKKFKAQLEQMTKPLPKDGDGDGKIFDGTKNEQPAPKKSAPKAKAPAKKPTASSAKKPAPKKKGTK